MALPTSLLLAPADSAYAVGEVYGLSLLATIPIVVAALLLVILRRSGAGVRALVCRSTVVALLALAAGRLLPVHSMLWVVPEEMAGPLVALGKAQLRVGGGAVGAADAASDGPDGWSDVTAALPGALVLYWSGVLVTLLVMARGRWRLQRLLVTATAHDAPAARALLAEAARAAGMEGEAAARVRLFSSSAVAVPLTWGGVSRPVIVLPRGADGWGEAQRRAALVHELSHIRHGDAPMAVAARVACALFWFHPGAWWLAARLSAESELACDDRVLLSGVRRSDYAELLANALLQGGGGVAGHRMGSMALVGARGVRRRLAAIVDTSRALRAPSRQVIGVAMLGSALLAAPLGTVRISPTRAVLTTLMQDVAWESRAYAVVRLAQRADSVEVARDAARHDPNPRVRAWAQFALGQVEARQLERRPLPLAPADPGASPRIAPSLSH